MVLSKAGGALLAKGSESLRLEYLKDELREKMFPVSFLSFPPSSPYRPVLNILILEVKIQDGKEQNPSTTGREKTQKLGVGGSGLGVGHAHEVSLAQCHSLSGSLHQPLRHPRQGLYPIPIRQRKKLRAREMDDCHTMSHNRQDTQTLPSWSLDSSDLRHPAVPPGTPLIKPSGPTLDLGGFYFPSTNSSCWDAFSGIPNSRAPPARLPEPPQGLHVSRGQAR